MLQKSGRLMLWEAMFILELHSADTQGIYNFLALECPRQSESQHSRHTQIHDHGQKNFCRLITKGKNTVHTLHTVVYRDQISV